MIKTLEEIKQEIADACQINFLQQKKEWWKSKRFGYKTISELVPDKDNYVQTADSFFIKNNYYSQLLGIAFGIILGIIILKHIYEEAIFIVFILSVIGFIVLLLFSIVELKDKRAKVVLTKNYFWFQKMEKHIPWEYLAASYIKEDYRDDLDTYLVLHYYNETKNSFEIFEYRFGDLEMEIQDICFHIEKFKEKNNGSAQFL
jgi:hypothetical protein